MGFSSDRLGIVLAMPLAAVCFVLLKKLWIVEVLEAETDVRGDEQQGGGKN